MIELLCGRQDRQVMLYFNLSSFSSSISWVNFLIFLQPKMQQINICLLSQVCRGPLALGVGLGSPGYTNKKTQTSKEEKENQSERRCGCFM